MFTREELNEQMEHAVGELYKVFFRMREAGFHQDEYDAIGTILNMLTEDRQVLQVKYGVKI